MLPYVRELNSRDSGMVYILNYMVLIASQVPLAIAVGLNDNMSTGMWISIFATQIGFFLVTFAFIRSRGINPLEITGYKHKLSSKQAGMLPVITILLLIASAPIALLFSMLIRRLGYTAPDIEFEKEGLIILYIIAVAVMPAICEEFLFRNAILRGMKKKGYLFSAIITSIMFSLMHGNAEQLVHQFFVGMVLAFAMHITNNLWAPIIIHFTNNFIAIMLQYILTDALFAGVNDSLFIIILFIMIIFGSVLVIMALKYFIKLELEKRMGKEIVEVNPDNFLVQYGKTAKSMIRFIYSSDARREFKEDYNSLMKELDYDKEEVTMAVGEEKFDLMKMIMKSRDNLTTVKVGIAIASVLVIISLLAGFTGITV